MLQDFQANLVLTDYPFLAGEALADALDIPHGTLSIIVPVRHRHRDCHHVMMLCSVWQTSLPCCTCCTCSNQLSFCMKQQEGPLTLQAFPVCHERSNLARLPVGSLPTFGTAYPVAMVSPLNMQWTHFKSVASASS